MSFKNVFAASRTADANHVSGINVTCDRESHYYHVGENAEIRIGCDKAVSLTVSLSHDGKAVLERRTISVEANEPYVFTFTLGRPGFLRCAVEGKDLETRLLGLAFDPEQIRPALPEPDDFMAFWTKAFAALDEIPDNFKMTEVQEDSSDECAYYELECDNVNGTKHYAYLKLPRTDKKVPLLIYVAGAGAGQGLEIFKKHNANVEKNISKQVATLTIGVHKYKPLPRFEDHENQHGEYIRQFPEQTYWLENIEARELTDNFFYRAILGCKRMCDIVSALPQIDQGHIVYLGVSQGGMFGLYLTAVCPQIRAAFCGVPAFCDCGGSLTGLHTQTSQIATLEKYTDLLRYFDAANFARHINVPVFLSAGYIDVICSPSSVFAAANSLGGPKLVYHKVNHGHVDSTVEYEGLYWTFVGRFLLGD